MFLGSDVYTTMLMSFEEGKEELSQARTTLSKNQQEIDELKPAQEARTTRFQGMMIRGLQKILN